MRKHTASLSILSIALVLSLVWGYNQYSIARQLMINQENQYQQSYADLTSHVDNMENFLAKAQGSDSNSSNLVHFTGAWQEANAGLNDLSSIPVQNQGTAYIANFLNQASDFSYTMAQKLAAGKSENAQEANALNSIHETARSTGEQLHALQSKHDTESLSWTGAPTTIWSRATGWIIGRAEADTQDLANPTSVTQGLQLLDNQLQKLPPLGLQGRFTSAVNQKPKGLPSGQVTKEQAQTNANKFAALVGLKYTFKYLNDAKGSIPTYRFSGNNDPNVVLTISKQGGVAVMFNGETNIGPRTLSIEQAKVKAVGYLSALGYPNMVLTSSEDYGSTVTLSYVAQQDGVKVYADKVIVTVAMDNGALAALNSEPYLTFHRDRSIGKTKLTVAQARKSLKSNFKVKDTSLVLLAKDNYEEVLCYEFRGTVGNEEYLDYINVSSGFEEQIYRVIRTPVGEYLK